MGRARGAPALGPSSSGSAAKVLANACRWHCRWARASRQPSTPSGRRPSPQPSPSTAGALAPAGSGGCRRAR
eukprot:15467396-Alexandrium_andersonii.AAC.1